MRSRLLRCCLVLGAIFAQNGAAVPTQTPAVRRNEFSQDPQKLIAQALKDISHQVKNHEVEIRTVEESLKTQEQVLEDLRTQVQNELAQCKESARAHRSQADASFQAIDQAIKNLESVMRGLVSDVQTLKTQANQTANLVSQNQQKVATLETLIEAQNQHLRNFEQALRLLMEGTVVKGSEPRRGGTYQVKPGDSLEKIAKAHRVSVQALRELNQLQSDRIVPGQSLRIPE